MKQRSVLFVAAMLAVLSAVAQSGSEVISEMVFKNPKRVSTTIAAGANGSVYLFEDVAPGIDATVKIKGRSSTSVVLFDIDVDDMGWNKAFQPQLGVCGVVAPNQHWWMDFEMTFYTANTSNKKKVKGFKATAIDVDGDNVSIAEYIQMNKVKSVAYSSITNLKEFSPATLPNTDYDDDNDKGSDKQLRGPVANFHNIDTLGTAVMATFTYEDKEVIAFRYGARSGAACSDAGDRLNSLWFRAFKLVPPPTAAPLPINFYSFSAAYDKGNVALNWSAEADDNLGKFTIERSFDGSTYQPVGNVGTKSGKASYSFTDVRPAGAASGYIYYRIQSKEATGEINYSAIRMVRLDAETVQKLSVYPNPVQSTTNVMLPKAWQNKAVVLSVYNSGGVEIKRVNIPYAGQLEPLNLSMLPKGIYVVKAQCENTSAEERILRN